MQKRLLTLVLPRKGLSLLPRLKLRERVLLRLRVSLRSSRYLPLRRGAGEADLVGERRRRTGEGDREYREGGVGERPYRSRDGDLESMAGDSKGFVVSTPGSRGEIWQAVRRAVVSKI